MPYCGSIGLRAKTLGTLPVLEKRGLRGVRFERGESLAPVQIVGWAQSYDSHWTYCPS